jgi:hypothetical protein
MEQSMYTIISLIADKIPNITKEDIDLLLEYRLISNNATYYCDPILHSIIAQSIMDYKGIDSGIQIRALRGSPRFNGLPMYAVVKKPMVSTEPWIGVYKVNLLYKIAKWIKTI